MSSINKQETGSQPDYSRLDEHGVFLRVVQAYTEAKQKRDNYKKYGPLTVILSGIVFLTLMFSLDSKIEFLCLWVVTDFFCAALMIRAEYKYNKYLTILGLSAKDENGSEGEEPQ